MALQRNPLPERLLGTTVVVLLAAWALYTAVHLLLSIIWFIVGVAAAGLSAVIGWQFWQRRDSGW